MYQIYQLENTHVHDVRCIYNCYLLSSVYHISFNVIISTLTKRLKKIILCFKDTCFSFFVRQYFQVKHEHA